MPLFETIAIDIDQVRQLARVYWDVEVGECLKASQNHTFLANKETTQRFVLRVTPDPDNKRFESTKLEVDLLEYLHENKLPVCRAVQSTTTSSMVIRSESLILCLFTFATGEPVVYTDWTWMTNKERVTGLGRWLAQLHTLTRRYVQEKPELAAHARHWTSLHDGILSSVEIDERDSQLVLDPNYFGLIHGDVNPSNYFWDCSVGMPCMFDWDQLQRCWFLYDLSAPIWGIIMLERAGSPIDQSAVPEANSELFTTWLLEGYESTEECVCIDRAALHRMVMIRRELYRRFCRKALSELPAEHAMAQFCKRVTDFFDKEESESSLSSVRHPL
jgi:Ser/Thr protein kinase RdoA (MazF antagonist)